MLNKELKEIHINGKFNFNKDVTLKPNDTFYRYHPELFNGEIQEEKIIEIYDNTEDDDIYIHIQSSGWIPYTWFTGTYPKLPTCFVTKEEAMRMKEIVTQYLI